MISERQVIGVLAHVDAGKTTLSEAMLYTTGCIKKLGRVDKGDTFLDTHEIERERGITIFSKQAELTIGDKIITLIDTPGHVDFSAETERTLSVLDYAILVISGSEGVQAHTETLWGLLERYSVPTFIFITKMDIAVCNESDIMSELENRLSAYCVNFSDSRELDERIAMTDELLLESYLSHDKVDEDYAARNVADRKLFPCYFGSGLKLDGIEELLYGLELYTVPHNYPEDFAAKVFKIIYDKNGTRMTYMRITGGSLSVREPITYIPVGDTESIEEKITSIRVYSGMRFETHETVYAGDICAVIGLTATYAGQGLGSEVAASSPFLEPVLNYRLKLPADAEPRILLPKLKMLEEEEPMLRIVWNEQYSEIHAQIMGQVQTEVLIRLISERCGVYVEFDEGRILYRETISGIVEGIGHFEPLRHYAEVHLVLEPLPAGSGLIYDTVCSENILERNWQRLILTHLEEKQHKGVLTGAPITDIKMTLTAGRAHLKHTVGGDFREATYRAVRQGLMTAMSYGKMVLLEPWYAFRLELPGEYVGRAIADIINMSGTFDEHEAEPGISILQGRAPVSEIASYSRDVAAYTHGRGRLSCRFDGYYPCHNETKVLADSDYNPEADIENTPDSVFCARGGSFIVPWDYVTQYMHISNTLNQRVTETEERDAGSVAEFLPPKVMERNIDIDDKELEELMNREFGPIRRKIYGKTIPANTPTSWNIDIRHPLYIIDGYNIIWAWEELAALAENDLEYSRNILCDLMVNYHAFTGREIVVVFDAYNVKGTVERKLDYHGISIVYTKTGELGDTYIEQLINRIGKDYSIRVVTSDSMIQISALRAGTLRMSAREFRDEVINADSEIKKLLEDLSKEQRKVLGKVSPFADLKIRSSESETRENDTEN